MGLVFILLTEWPPKLRQSCRWRQPVGSQLCGLVGRRGGPFGSSDERGLTKAFRRESDWKEPEWWICWVLSNNCGFVGRL